MIKSEKGSVTLLVAVTVLLIVIILSSSLMLVSLKRKSQLQESKILQEIYGGDNLDEIYQEQLEKKSYSNLSSTSFSASDITLDLYGIYVDIGLEINDNNKVDDWEIFYAGNDRIYLIATDYVPTSKLEDWNVIGEGTTLDDAGFSKYNNYVVNWQNAPTQFFNLPTEPEDFLSLVKHNGYNLEENKTNANSIAVSQLINSDAWSGIKEATSMENQKYIDFVIGGPTLEMLCTAWNKTVDGDENEFISITADSSGETGYYVSSEKMKDQTWLYMNGTQTELGDKLDILGTKYKTFFPHTALYEDCYGYWLASPCADSSDGLMRIRYDGRVLGDAQYNVSYGVRPIICLKSETNIAWDSENEMFKLTSSSSVSP